MEKSHNYWFILATLALFFFAWMVVGSYFRPTSLTVVGVGRITTAPQEVSLIVTKVTQGAIASTAIAEGDREIKLLIDQTKQITKDPELKIQQSFYRVSTTATSQYVVANAFSVRTNNVTAVDTLQRSLFQAGATSVSDVSFTTSDQNKTEQEARIKAVEDAKRQAQLIAQSANKRLGKILSIQDDNTPAASSIQTGTDIDIVKRVAVIYELW